MGIDVIKKNSADIAKELVEVQTQMVKCIK